MTMDGLRIITNNVPRFILDAHELTPQEREEFDYLDWQAIERGEDSASFVRYRGETYDLGEFTYVNPAHYSAPLTSWHGIQSDTFFSGVLVRYVDDDTHGYGEVVVMAHYYS